MENMFTQYMSKIESTLGNGKSEIVAPALEVLHVHKDLIWMLKLWSSLAKRHETWISRVAHSQSTRFEPRRNRTRVRPGKGI
mmetsp:Transcript_23966/g.38309  ORF Transcript_23966/g.38309 Transcript_23966/m.38309 type:complete len:82 (+) Transcript_23966:2307-2552(+)